MRIKQLALLGTAVCFAGAAFAGEQMRTKMAVAVVDDDGGAETRFELDSDELGFDLHDMQAGEQRSIVDEAGRAIVITREADGFAFDVDGKTIRVPLMHGARDGAKWLSDNNSDIVEIEITHGAASPAEMDGIMIVSEKPIDDATQQAVTSMLASAGHGGVVRFIDSETAHSGPHKIRKVIKRVESNE